MSSVYQELAELPTYASAQFIAPNAIQATLYIRDHTRNIKRSLVKTIFIDHSSNAANGSPSQELSDIVASVLSPSGKRRAQLREVSDSTASDGKKRFIEIWHGDKLETVRDVTASHGVFYSDEHVSTLTFNPSEDGLLYTAESKPDDETSQKKFKYVPNLGETFAPKKSPTLFLFVWSTDVDVDRPAYSTLHKIEVSLPTPIPVFFAKAAFIDHKQIYATGYENTPDGRLLGVVYCTNRPAGIWRISLNGALRANPDESYTTTQGAATRTTAKERSCRSVRLFPELYSVSKTRLFWLSNPIGGPHASTVSLHSLNLSTNRETLLVDSVWDLAPGAFPGLYTETLPERPFLQLGHNEKKLHIITSSQWRSRSTVLLISAETGSVVDLTPDEGSLYSWSVLGTDGQSLVLCSRSSPTSPPELVLGYVDNNGRVQQWLILDKPVLSPRVKNALSALESTVISVPNHFPTETIVIKKKIASAIQPTINNPHGGPHSVTTTGFQAAVAAFAIVGYTFAMPNYTGSLGFGEKYVKKLIGRCGTLDVGDCIASTRHLVKLGISKEGPGQQFIIGGSHGGFLAGHLIGQFPDTFSAASIRNPVISVGELSTTDIPDWYFQEFDIAFGPESLVTPTVYNSLYKASPISHVDAVKTPVLLLIGEKDQRVAQTQGKNYYHALKARGRDVEMLCFPEDWHALDKVETAKVCWEEAKALFEKFRLAPSSSQSVKFAALQPPNGEEAELVEI